MSNKIQQEADTPKASERRRLDVNTRREQLLDVGRRFFATKPYEAVSIDEIATEAGISRGLLYHYFPSKRKFFLAAMQAEAEEIRARVAPADDLPPDEQLRASLDVYIRYVREHAAVHEALFRAGAGSDRELARILADSDEVQVQRLHELLTGETRSEALRIALHGWIAYNRALVLDWLERRQISREQLRELMVHGLTGAVQAAQQVDPALEIGPQPPEPL